jgi:hypothetical protein
MNPKVTHTGASVTLGGTTYSYTPAIFTGVDFSDSVETPVTFTVTAADGTTQDYSVHVGLNPAKELTSFTFAGVTITNPGTAFTVTLPYGTPISGVTPTYTVSSDASLSSNGGLAWTGASGSTKQYTVTAANGTTQPYTVTVNVASLSSIVIGGTYKITYKIGDPLDTSGMTVTGTDSAGNTGISIPLSACGFTALSSATAGTTTITLTVTGTGVTETFTVTVQNNAKAITAFSLAGVAGTITGTGIVVDVPYGTNLTSLTPSILHTGASYSPTSAQNFSDSVAHPITYTVMAEDGTSQVYTVTVTIRGQGTIAVHFTGAPQDETTSLVSVGITDNKVSWLTDSLTLTAPTTGIFSGASYQWYKDGTTITDATTNTLIISAKEFSIAPNHRLTVKITTTGGVVYSKTLTFEVE